MDNEEKAFERLHTDSSHVPGPDDSGKVWLNSVGVVDRIVRDFLLEVIEHLEQPDQIQSFVEFHARRLNNLFLGITPSDKYSIGPWNSPEQCGEYVLKELGIDGESRLAVRDALTILVARVMEIIAKSGDEFDSSVLEPEIGRIRDVLLGTVGAMEYESRSTD